MNFVRFIYFIKSAVNPQVFSLWDVRHYISAGTVDYTGGEGVSADLLKGRSSVKPESHESLAHG